MERRCNYDGDVNDYGKYCLVAAGGGNRNTLLQP